MIDDEKLKLIIDKEIAKAFYNVLSTIIKTHEYSTIKLQKYATTLIVHTTNKTTKYPLHEIKEIQYNQTTNTCKIYFKNYTTIKLNNVNSIEQTTTLGE